MKQLSSEEKRYILIGGIMLFVIIYFGFIIFPALGSIKKLQSQIPKKTAEYKQMLALSAEFSQIKGQKITEINQPLLTYLGNKINFLNLSENLVSIRPLYQSGNEIEIKFENLSGDEVTRFLYEMQKLPLIIRQVSLTDYENDNRWTLRIIVSGNA